MRTVIAAAIVFMASTAQAQVPEWARQMDPATYSPPPAVTRPASLSDRMAVSASDLNVRLTDQWVEMINPRVVRFFVTVEARSTHHGQLGVRCTVRTNRGWKVVEYLAFEPTHVMRTGSSDSYGHDVTLPGATAEGRCIVLHRNDVLRR